jgi:stage V sporulation protein AC
MVHTNSIGGLDMDEATKKNYNEYVEKVTPTHNLWMQMFKAYVVGGLICTLGQGIGDICSTVFKMDVMTAAAWTSITLIFLSVFLTALGVYPTITKFGGAGALVPITGFANSVAAPAVEFKKEGQVFGIGCKIFTIAGPVILYGIFSSWILGLGYWLIKRFL